MSRNLVFPRFPNPPQQYDARYFTDFLRAFATYQQQMQNPGEGRNTTIVLTNLQSNDQGLEPGTIFQVDGALRISILSRPYVGGVQAVGGVGQITKAP